MPDMTANPLRHIGLARALAGLWFVSSALRRLPDAKYQLPQAARLFGGAMGATDAPVRSLLELFLTPILLFLGVVMLVRGVRWMRHIAGTPPSPLALQEATAVLEKRQLPAYESGTLTLPWPMHSWLDEDLGRATWWRRGLIAQAQRSLTRAIALAMLITAITLVAPDDIAGPLPLRFIILYPLAAALWASLALLLIGSAWPRVEVIDLPMGEREKAAEPFRESPPALLGREPPALGTAIALVGVATQCALLSWWTLDTISYPLLATSILRHLGAIGGGVLLFMLGGRMITAGTELLRRVHYDSVVVILDERSGERIARGAEVRTESRDLDGERQIISAVGSAHARNAVLRLLS